MDIAKAKTTASNRNSPIQREPAFADLWPPARTVAPSTRYPFTIYLIGGKTSSLSALAVLIVGACTGVAASAPFGRFVGLIR
jgi:hypothetical protein